jgi:hypothetical protein
MDKILPCPRCGKPVTWGPLSPDRPFCSARCRLIDLGDWLDESHRIPDPDAQSAADAPDIPSPMSAH